MRAGGFLKPRPGGRIVGAADSAGSTSPQPIGSSPGSANPALDREDVFRKADAGPQVKVRRPSDHEGRQYAASIGACGGKMEGTDVDNETPSPRGGRSSLTLSDVGDETIASLRRWIARLLGALERWGRTRRWRAAATLVILLAALLMSFPSLDGIGGGDWNVIHQVGRHPFTDLGFDQAGHAGKFLYRVTMPIVGETLGLSPAGYMVLQALFGVLMVYALLVALERVTRDRVTTFLFALAACMTYGGVVAFVETRGNFDGVALALLVVALAWPRPAVIGSMVFLAAWTDERALLASGLLLACFAFERAVRDSELTENGMVVRGGGRRGTAQMAAVLAAAVAYAVSRGAVATAFDLPQPTGGVGPSVLLDQLNNAAVGIWTGLEGLWIPLLLALLLLWRARMRLLATFTGAVIAVIVLFALSVVDITRSMAYLLPAVVFSAVVMATMLPRSVVHRVALVSLAMSAVWPIYYVGGKSSIWWYYPLPIHLIRLVTGAGS